MIRLSRMLMCFVFHLLSTILISILQREQVEHVDSRQSNLPILMQQWNLASTILVFENKNNDF